MPDIPLYLAPLAGFTDKAFRRLCKDCRVDYLVSEMVSADGISRDSLKTEQYAHFTEYERPFIIQIFGSKPAVMAKAAAMLLELSPDMIDINMGCPVKKVVKRGAGSALMKDPENAAAIVKEVKNALSGSIPLSVKFRSGWDMKSLNYLDFGLRMQDAGADTITLHPRTTSQMFSGQSNWAHIAELKQALCIPLIGNGDIGSPEDALRMVQETGCDALMIGRAALGKPWLFGQIKDFIATGDYRPITASEILDSAMKHIDYTLEYKPEHVVVREMRSQLCHYTKNQPGSAALRARINQCESIDRLKDELTLFFST